MNFQAKRLARSLVNRVGYDLATIREINPDGMRLMRLLDRLRINCALDVGANTGQTGRYLRRIGYKGTLISFEPVRSAHAFLVAEAKDDPNWIVASRCAIGAKSGSLEVNVSCSSEASSLLPMNREFLGVTPSARYIDKERIEVKSLDAAALEFVKGRKTYLKIDTQGYEGEVLAGASAILRLCPCVELEVSFEELYAGQPLFREIWRMMEDRGFVLWDLEPGLRSVTDKLLQADAIFVQK
jgi:FkbM family methyltransferase